jgi:UDP-N-acetylmuramyl pentapeptide phosphotransferase/UDP-N-acetylglucosamine-1-phosphate transferase
MTLHDIELAERHARTRSLIMAVMAVVLLILGLLGWRDDASSMSPMLRHAMWAITIVFWLLILATGGWLKLSRDVRRLMNDEVALAHRSAALQTGFWTAMLLALALYFASLDWAISLREGLRILTDVTIAAALLRYAWLELR